MNNSEKIYTSLCIFFTSLITLGNLTYQKFVSLQTPFYTFELSVGAILYPVTFFITDLIAEFYGRDRAQFCIRFAIVMNIVVAAIITFMDILPATQWSKIDDATFHQMFGFFNIAFTVSIIACYISQAVDIRLYIWIRALTKGKYLWLRSNGSTCVSLLIDTTVVISLMSVLGIIPSQQIGSLIINSYSWKIGCTMFSTPLFYISVFMIKRLIKKDA